MDEKERIIFYGGTFDPVHNGHLAIANYVYEQCGCSKVVWIPNGNTPLKKETSEVTPDHRFKMLQLAIQPYSYFFIYDKELDDSQKNYTIDTLENLKSVYEGREFFYVIGTDQLRQLHLWNRYEELIEMTNFIVVKRPNFPIDNDVKVDIKSKKFTFIDNPVLEISSATIRQRIKNKLAIDFLVPKEVHQYIQEHYLYL